jgi:hypothetical protein
VVVVVMRGSSVLVTVDAVVECSRTMCERPVEGMRQVTARHHMGKLQNKCALIPVWQSATAR